MSFTRILLKEKYSNCRLCYNYNSYSFHIHKILSILNVLSIYVTIENLLRKMYIEGALMSKSSNIVLNRLDAYVATAYVSVKA